MKLTEVKLIFACLLICISAQLHAHDENSAALSFGIPLQPGSALVHLANSHNLLSLQSGVEIDLNYFVSGREAIDSSQSGEALDIIFAADIAFLSKANLLEDYRVVALIFESDNVNRIVSLAKNPDALASGTLCTQKNSAVHFFGSMVLARLNINQKPFQFYPIANLIEELGSGACDAITLRSPYVEIAQETYDVDVLEMPGAYVQRELMLAHEHVTDEELGQVINALITAEEILYNDKQTSIDLISKAINADPSYVEKILTASSTRVELKQIVLPMFELQATWINKVNPSYKMERQTLQLLRDQPMQTYFPERNSVVKYD